MTHDEATLLLPWLVNGTLTTSQRAEVESHVAACARCTAEISLLRDVAGEMAGLRAAEPSPSPDRLAGVMAQIRASKLERIDARPLGESKRAVQWWQLTPRYARVALAAQFLLVIGLGAWIGGLYAGRRAATASAGDGEAARIAVAFQPGVSEATVRTTVQNLEGTIVEGPSALGLYTVMLGLPADSVAAVERALAGLRRDTSVVRLAERVQ